jgi:DNA repair exonuclease SbcCD ATPase subunit
MRPVTLTLHNVCQHLDRVFVFEPGITGIVGRNGSGKSNLLQALFFSLTGKTGDDFTKSDLKNWDASTAHTILEFDHDGHRYFLRRNIHNTTVSLSGDALDKTLNGGVANETMESIMGMSASHAYETCWTPQGSLTSVLTMTHASRIAFFQRLANIRKAETIRGMLSSALSKLVNFPDRVEEIQDLETALKEELLQQEEARVSGEALEVLNTEYQGKLSDIQAVLGLPTEAMYTGLVERSEGDVTVAQAAYDSFWAANQLQDLDPVEPPSPESQEKADRYLHLQSAQDRRQTAVETLAKFDDVVPSEVEEPRELRQLYDNATDAVTEATPRYQLAKRGKCPTCDREYDFGIGGQRDILTEFQSLTDKLTEAQENISKAEDAYSTYRDAKDRFDLQRSGAEAIQKSAQTEIDTIGEISFDIDAHNAHTVRYQAYAQELSRRQGIDSQLRALQGALDKAKLTMEQAELTRYASDSVRGKADEFMLNYRGLQTTRAQTASRLGGLKESVEAKQSLIDTYRVEQDKRESTAHVRVLFERSREVLHRDTLPTLVMQKMLQGLNALLDNYLAVFDTEFTTYINENFEFMSTFGSHTDKPVRHLSGGQKVALALAFKFAVSELLANQIPLLSLDEPTVWLDDINKPRLVELLEKAAEVAEAGVYVLVATHEPLLYPAFSQIEDVSLTEKAIYRNIKGAGLC